MNELSLATLRQQINDALKLLYRNKLVESPLASLYLYKIALRTNDADVKAATIALLERGLEQLATQNNHDAEILRLHFIEGELVQTIAGRLNLAEGTIYNRQNQAITDLTEILWELEQTAVTEYYSALAVRLHPPSNTNVVGIGAHLDHLTDLFCVPGPPWLVALAGMGGIGKTTLADAVVRRVIQRKEFDDVGWVTAQQKSFHATKGLRSSVQPAITVDELLRSLLTQFLPETQLTTALSTEDLQRLLRAYLDGNRYLIVIDNLETLTDVETLLTTLRNLANPTKFLLTSRESLFGEVDVYHFSVPELSGPLTLNLVRQEAKLRNLPDLLAADDKLLQPIVETVGGNPLAIRLVVGQSHVHPLTEVLDNLRAARGQTIENLYTYIYRQAWDALDELARRTLLVMPLVSNLGGTREHIGKVSQLEPRAVVTALDQLVRLNLVDSRGGLNERRYTIHNLTASFLHEQVIRWGVPQ